MGQYTRVYTKCSGDQSRIETALKVRRHRAIQSRVETVIRHEEPVILAESHEISGTTGKEGCVRRQGKSLVDLRGLQSP